jgi:nitrite reductase/ring-hydroxylating ferredoxin subunit
MNENNALDRRAFFDRLAKGALAAAGAVFTVEAAAMVAHSDQRPLPRVATAGLPEDYAVGSSTYIEEAQAWLGRDPLGFYAIDAHCTHLGCLVKHAAESFECPCHGSKFAFNGRVQQGPAPRNLRFLLVELTDDGKLSIDRARLVDAAERLIA